MAGESAFDKRHVEASTLSDVEGLLEHLNLPPAAIKYIRNNKRKIQICTVVAISLALIWAAYDAYRVKRIEKATSALSLALQQGPEGEIAALNKVTEEFSGTSSALWAKVELAHLDMQNTKFADAADKYKKIHDDLKKSDPLYALTLYGFAQAKEANHDYKEAIEAYMTLKDIVGYQVIAYTGKARIEEAEGQMDKALATLNEFVATLGDKPANDPGKRYAEEKIARLKARK
jgi:tetratricopeptide (TPR) repeat protein